MSSFITVPIVGGGNFEVTTAAEGVYVLAFTSPPDNRVILPFIDAFSKTLDILEIKTKAQGAVIITSGIAKFFSNGFDLDHALAHADFFERCIGLLNQIMIYSMPTVAWINGHCFGAGVFIAMACDYRIQNPSKGFICLPEVDLGIPIPTSIAAMLKAKLPSLRVYRDLAIEGRRVSGPDALKMEIVDGLGGLEECVKFIGERKLAVKNKGGAVGALKEDLYREVLFMFAEEGKNVAWRTSMEEKREKRLEKLSQEVSEWEKKAKL